MSIIKLVCYFSFLWFSSASSAMESDLAPLNLFLNQPTVTEFKELEKSVIDKLQQTGPENIIASKKANTQVLIDVLKIYFPDMLPNNFPGKTLYMSCSSYLQDLKGDLLNREVFSRYESCVKGQYGNDIPERRQQLLDALGKIKK